MGQKPIHIFFSVKFTPLKELLCVKGYSRMIEIKHKKFNHLNTRRINYFAQIIL